MNLYLNGLPYGYELQRVCQMFFFGEKVLPQPEGPQDPQESPHLGVAKIGGELRAWLYDGEQTLRRCPAPEAGRPTEERLAVLLYGILSEYTGLRPSWGVLTGVRPIKQMVAALEDGMSEEAIRKRYQEDLLVSPQRLQLALDTARTELPILRKSTPDSFSLYVSIPFCPTRCAYCSFVSHSVGQAARLVPDYLDHLCQEIQVTAAIVRNLGLKLRTVYFGGGTPTTLSAEQLGRVMKTVEQEFDLSELWEYTVEAGRPDTITKEKLETIRALAPGVRVSINPQTLSDQVLEAIGRRHTTSQLYWAMDLARSCGLENINMDLIAGLPTDSLEGFQASVNGVLDLHPENITVHTLTVKRAANLTFQQAKDKLDLVGDMVNYARCQIGDKGYAPYYLYRQTGTLSSLENVGYAKPGCEGLYNVYIMDETHSILAVGAGASTKLRHPVTGKIERVYNYKYPYEYISQFSTVLERRERIRAFYQEAK